MAFVVGQEVAVTREGYGGQEYWIDRVKRITPTGLVVTGGKNVFYPDGHERHRYHYKARLVPLTDEFRAVVQRQNRVSQVSNLIRYLHVEDLPDAVLEQLLALLETTAPEVAPRDP